MDDASLDETLVGMLVCPLCREPVGREDGGLRCGRCGRVYPVRDGIPVMLAEAAEASPDSTGEAS